MASCGETKHFKDRVVQGYRSKNGWTNTYQMRSRLLEGTEEDAFSAFIEAVILEMPGKSPTGLAISPLYRKTVESIINLSTGCTRGRTEKTYRPWGLQRRFIDQHGRAEVKDVITDDIVYGIRWYMFEKYCNWSEEKQRFEVAKRLDVGDTEVWTELRAWVLQQLDSLQAEGKELKSELERGYDFSVNMLRATLAGSKYRAHPNAMPPFPSEFFGSSGKNAVPKAYLNKIGDDGIMEEDEEAHKQRKRGRELAQANELNVAAWAVRKKRHAERQELGLPPHVPTYGVDENGEAIKRRAGTVKRAFGQKYK